ncbi:MAG: hypothetical protein ACFCUS_12160 [Rubrimonas sp.]|uniref:hypothetical protein n=1 Tax=Rubrimonas sp. TaxID=2036015 RepID=UPI002FDD5275
MTTTPMTPARFEALCAAEGGDLARWPEAERAAARALLAVDPAAQAALRACAPLDDAFAALRAAPPPELPAGLAERLARDASRALTPPPPRPAARPAARPGARRVRSGLRPVAALAAPMAASVALGLWLGGSGALDPFGVGAAPAELEEFAALDLASGAPDLAYLFGDAP